MTIPKFDSIFRSRFLKFVFICFAENNRVPGEVTGPCDTWGKKLEIHVGKTGWDIS